MKFSLLALLSCSWLIGISQVIDSIIIDNTALYYHKINSEADYKKGVIIFMHGGVSQFLGLDQVRMLSTNDILEGNTEFIPYALKEGFDLLFPIAFNNYNWLMEEGKSFVLGIGEKYRTSYDKIIISGFSDGGTGAYHIFYSSPELFDGLIIFNGYPQLKNFHKNVKYELVTDKPIIYASTKSDKRIPYEFLLVEYRRQKIFNQCTYFSLSEGEHSFSEYTESEFNRFLKTITINPEVNTLSDSTLVHAPIDGWVKADGELIEIYPFRKKIGKGYGMKEEEYTRADEFNSRYYSKLIQQGTTIKFSPISVSNEAVKNQHFFEFICHIEGQQRKKVKINNWITIKTWE